jgi:hypothetical protein
MHISGYLLNQAVRSVKELIPSQSKKGLNVEHKKSTIQIKKLFKQDYFPPTPFPTWWTQVWWNLISVTSD